MYTLLIATWLFLTGVVASLQNYQPSIHTLPLSILASKEGKKWRLTSWTATHIKDGKAIHENMFDYFDDCENDNILILFADSRYETREGASACNPLARDLVEAGRWELRNRNTQMAIISKVDTLVVTIKEMTESTIKTTYTDTDPVDGLAYTITQIYHVQ